MMIQGLTFHDRYYHRTHFKNTPELYERNLKTLPGCNKCKYKYLLTI